MKKIRKYKQAKINRIITCPPLRHHRWSNARAFWIDLKWDRGPPRRVPGGPGTGREAVGRGPAPRLAVSETAKGETSSQGRTRQTHLYFGNL